MGQSQMFDYSVIDVNYCVLKGAACDYAKSRVA